MRHLSFRHACLLFTGDVSRHKDAVAAEFFSHLLAIALAQVKNGHLQLMGQLWRHWKTASAYTATLRYQSLRCCSAQPRGSASDNGSNSCRIHDDKND